MKKQTFISRSYNVNDIPVNFERWHYKSVISVINALKTLYNTDLYYTCDFILNGAFYVVVYDNNDQPVTDKIYITDLREV